MLYPTAGWPVLYFKSKGLRDAGDPGAPSIVTKAGTEGAMNLMLSGQVAHTPRHNVRYIEDPWHQNFPQQSAEDGCWDWNPQFPPQALQLFKLLNDNPELFEALRAILEATETVAEHEVPKGRRGR